MLRLLPHLRSHLPVFQHSQLCSMAALWQQSDQAATINLGKGHPNPRLLPLSHISAAFNAATQPPNAAVTLLQYGRMQGNQQLCQAISNLLAKSRPSRRTPSPEQILVTTGSGPALAVIMQLYTRPGDIILVDAPGYFLAYYTFEDCGLKVVSVETDAEGMDVTKVEQLLKEGVRPSMVYTVPIANNPTGVGMSEVRKRRLVALAREYGFKIAADEVYMFLKFASDDVPSSLFEYDDPDNPVVFSVNSFSKLLGPGIRVGWVATNRRYIDRLLDCGTLQSGGGFNPFASAVVLPLLEDGFVEGKAHELRQHYRQNCTAMCDALDTYVAPILKAGEQLKFERPEGGFFVFVTLPQRFDVDRLLQVAKKMGVSYFQGKHFSPAKSTFKNCFRLCFAFCEKSEVVEGIKRLANAMREY